MPSPFNLAVLVGRLSRDSTELDLPSGDRLVRYEVTVERVDGPADSVPVCWLGAPARSGTLAAGTEVAVVGTVRRRFFRTPGGVQSRTEVAALSVVPATRKTAGRALGEAADRLAALAERHPHGL